jgi:LPS sulfotransferase NodH
MQAAHVRDFAQSILRDQYCSVSHCRQRHSGFENDIWPRLISGLNAPWAAIGQFFATSGIAPYRVVYEEFSPRYEETILALLRWLGVTPPPDLTLPDPRTVKLADDRTDEWVTRFRELQAANTPG